MPSRTIENEQGDRAGADASPDFGQVHVHDVDIDSWHDQCNAGAACGANRTEQISPCKAAVARDPRARAALRPDPAHCALLADPGFILEPDFYRASGALRRDRGTGQFGEVFLVRSSVFGRT